MIKLVETLKEANVNEIDNDSSTIIYEIDIKVDKEITFNASDEDIDDFDNLMEDEIDDLVENGLDRLTDEINDSIHAKSIYKDLTFSIDDTDDYQSDDYIMVYGSVEVPLNDKAINVDEIKQIIDEACQNFYFSDYDSDDLDIGKQIPGTGYPSFDPPEYESVNVSVEVTLTVNEDIKFVESHD